MHLLVLSWRYLHLKKLILCFCKSECKYLKCKLLLCAMSSIPGYYKCGAVQWLRGSRHKVQPFLWHPAQTSQVLGQPLAAPRHEHLRTHPALRAAAPGGWVEVGAPFKIHIDMTRIKKDPSCVWENVFFCLFVFFWSGTIWGFDTSRQISWRNFKMTELRCCTFTFRSVEYAPQRCIYTSGKNEETPAKLVIKVVDVSTKSMGDAGLYHPHQQIT